MSLLQQKVTLKDGRSILLRMVTLEDVDQISSYINEVRKDAPFILTDSRELKEISREQSLEFVQTAIKTGLFLIAVDGNEFVGNIDMRAGGKLKNRHEYLVGMSILPTYRGLGLGTALVHHALKWAKNRPDLERIGLEVMSGNTAGIRLYEQSGFKHEGRRRNAFKQPDGTFQDSLIMGILREELPD